MRPLILITFLFIYSCRPSTKYYEAEIEVLQNNLNWDGDYVKELDTIGIQFMDDIFLQEDRLCNGDGSTIIVDVINFKILLKNEILEGRFLERGGAGIQYTRKDLRKFGGK